MLIEHDGRRPAVAASAWVAPTAVVCGDVTVGEDCRVLYGAVLVADGGPVVLGDRVIVMEQAVLRGRDGHPCVVEDQVLVGPHAHVNGALVREGAFLATGTSVFPGAEIGAGAEVRINGVVHVNSTLPAGAVVPIGWVAVGDPAEVHPPAAHDAIDRVQRTLDFVGTVYGIERAEPRQELGRITARYAALFGRHRDDVVLD